MRRKSAAADRPDIVMVLEHYGADSVPSGFSWRNMRCPFHDDRNASAQVNSDTGFFRCFTCDFFGDGFEIVKWKEGVEFPDAKRLCAELSGTGDGTLRAAGGSGSGVPGSSWHQRVGGSGGKAGRGRYTGTYSR